ncbi:ATP-binding cassette sub-family C member 3-like [Mercenaria mercenaria]|uniref:ATP-binding cassette sub-family C member 3-like n=1 Tax=Mercenaria mercenaria TaxID=6596 RepID=UPI00234EF212|nr:ATP-binding cassette sub-family C member 3-like [Mercenaria mercenaria]
MGGNVNIFGEYCGGEIFWNSSNVLKQQPEFSTCFLNTVLVWVPCGFLWIVFPLFIWSICTKRNVKPLPLSKLNVSKGVMSLLAAVMVGLQLRHVHFSDRGCAGMKASVAFNTACGIKIATFLLSIVLQQFQRLKGIKTSGVPLAFWAILVASEIPTLYTNITNQGKDACLPTFEYYVFFLFIVVQFVLHCFAENYKHSENTEKSVKNACPEENASVFNHLLYEWFTPVVHAVYKKTFDIKTFWSLPCRLKNETVGPVLEKAWDNEVTYCAKARYIIQLIEDNDSGADSPTWIGYFYCLALVLFTSGSTVYHHTSFTHMLVLGLNVKSALMALIYRKAVRMKTSGNQTTAVGEVVNHMSVDCQRIQDAFTFSGYSVLLVVITTFTVLQLWGLMGIAAAGSLVVILVVLPVVGFIGIQQYKLQKELLNLKGSRIKILNEVINGIKVLKMYAWETSFINRIESIRSKEVTKLWKYAWLSAISVVLSMHTPFMMTFTLIAIYVSTSPTHSLQPRETFTAVTIVNVIKFAISLFPSLVNGLVQAYASIGRIQAFLRTPDINENNVQEIKQAEFAISIEDGDFAWKEDRAQMILKDINLQVNDGELLAVVGQVGSGKSSLISAILGEMERYNGSVKTKGSTAYVPQAAWIQNMKLKDNILFGKEYRQKKYLKVIDACALGPDLQILPGGDETEIGERGINVSGGQKQRISLARAVYNNADIYLLDDPLSAVDSHVGKDLFDKVIGNTGLLKNKTRVLVTHGLHWLPMVDRIVVLVDGRISEIGSYAELMSHDGPFAQLLHQYMQDENENEDTDAEFEGFMEKMRHDLEDIKSDGGLTTDDDMYGRCNCCVKRKGKLRRRDESYELSRTVARTVRLTQDELPGDGAIKPSVFLNFIKAMGFAPFVVFLICMSLYQGLNLYSNIWLSVWTQTNVYMQNASSVLETETHRNAYMFYLMIYLALGILQGIFIYIAFHLVLTRMARASGKLHTKMLESVLRSPSSFFDTTPNGRIMNRFSSDVDIIDTKLPNNFRLFSLMTFSVLAILVVISILTPVFIAIMVVAGIIYALLVRYFLPTVRLMRRHESVRRSPIYNHFSETLTGSMVIRAYKCGQRFAEEFRRRIDDNMKYYYASVICTRWIGIRVETISNVIILVTNIMTIASGLSGSEVGLSVSYATMITITINVAIFAVSELLMDTVSVERVAAYTSLPAEFQADKMPPRKHPPVGWPRTGKIEFKNFWTRYRQGLDLVLRGITLTIRSGEKVGVVGRTGAGKSSLTLSIFRMLEATSGTIYIDGVDISELELDVLRINLTILPQDPVLFSGSLRFNLDPFGCFDDDSIWRAIECAHLKQFVLGLEDRLLHECGEGGQNLSIGQRQLVCLARTLLHKTKVLILDEATAAVDIETDDLIQDTIRKEFNECTILTIAHRLHTVMDYDRVVVMDAGCIKEVDAPQSLLQNPNTIFHGMAKDAGLI